MHQPYYKNDATGHYVMPWVYLHGIKDYYDMLWYLSAYPSLKATFNLVPSLLVQLKDYESTSVNDKLIRTLAKEVCELSQQELLYLMEFLFFAQKETMIDPIARYSELYRKIESTKNIADRIKVLSHDELLDLEVCFLLSWCGEYLRHHSLFIRSLLGKRHFTQYEKITLLEELAGFVAKIVPYYKQLQESGQIEVSTTPFYHPIMPLLMDPKNALLANEYVLMPKNPLSFKEDADEHITRAINSYETLFGQKPKGFWPSEGSVDNASITGYMNYGIKWIGTDEAILFKSVPDIKREKLFNRCRLKNSSGEIGLFFRDHRLSDAIGFEYSRIDPSAAAADFIRRLSYINNAVIGSCQVNIILDGENAWEFYRNNAKDFFDALYGELEKCDWITMQTMSDALVNEKVDEFVIREIVPGSWINSDFSVWIGQEEKNHAWELVYQAKRDFESCKGTLTEANINAIRNELMIVEGSDWYWWFGDTHYTVLRGEFEKLFRKHLKNAYTLMGMEIPSTLCAPIIKYETKDIHITPKNSVSVTINGEHSSFFEWMGAGEFNLEKMGTVMDSSTPYVKKILYGNDEEAFNIALVGNFGPIIAKAGIQIRLNGELYTDVLFENTASESITIGCGEEFVEISLPLKKIKKERFDLKIVLIQGEELLQNIPFHGGLTIDLSNRHRGNWFI